MSVTVTVEVPEGALSVLPTDPPELGAWLVYYLQVSSQDATLSL